MRPSSSTLLCTITSVDFFQLVLTLEEQVEHLAHLVLPVHRHHQRVRLHADHSRLQLHNVRLHEDLPPLPTFNLPVPGVRLPLLNGLEVSHVEGGGGDQFVAEDHGEQAGILVDDGGSGPPVLDVGVAAELFLGGEDAVCVGDAVGVDLGLPEVGAVEEEALHAFAQAVVEKGLVQLHVPVHDALLQQLRQAVMVQVRRHDLLLLRRQARTRHHLREVRHAQVRQSAAHQAPSKETSHQLYTQLYAYNLPRRRREGAAVSKGMAYNLNNVQ